MSVEIVKWSVSERPSVVTKFLERPAFSSEAEDVAREVLAEIKKNGNHAIEKYIKKFEKIKLTADEFAVKRHELTAARSMISDVRRSAIYEAHKRVVAFSKTSLRKDWSMSCPRGGTMGEQFVPLKRVGVYVPGGAAPLVSTALMTITLAKVAGVSEIVVCTPCTEGENLNQAMLHALEVAGATEVYKVGGIQAIGLMAYGTSTVKKVDKIVGPGGTFVTAAKRAVYGDVALDLVAGPSEIAILADDTAEPSYVAADLLSQAEHGTGWEKALLVTSSKRLADAVQKELDEQVTTLSKRKLIEKVMKTGILIVVVNTLDEGMDLCNEFAPEHFEVMVREPKSWLKKVKNAGAVFVGQWTPESVGDFVAGPSHVLPTGGAARMFSGLTVEDFRRRTSFVAFTRADLKEVVPIIDAFGEMEGLDAHARSARIRFEKK
ncbi:MAG: histidinol dehydrogenase [Kiritimatiellae bacterium]|nr:histidinol dehydrogenase [Kiritimatiellia bacterium]